MQRLKEGVARIGALFVAALASTAVVAQSDNSSIDVQQGIPIFLGQAPQSQSGTMQDCQKKAAELANHGQCGQGDLACVARLTTELKNSVEKTCLRAIEELKPLSQRYPLQ